MIKCKHKDCKIIYYINYEDNFNKDKSKPNGYHPYCKLCRKEIHRKHWQFKHSKEGKKCIQCKVVDISHKHGTALRCDDCIRINEISRKRPAKDKSRERALKRIWRRNNPDKIAKYRKIQKELRKEQKLSKS